MKLSLVVMTAGKSKGQAVPINLPQFIIGRDPQCNLRPASAAISKRHCAVLTKEGKVFIRDFESTNGTFINDVPVKGEVPIKNDDVLKIGPLEFKVVVEVKVPGSKPTPPPAKPSGSDDDSVAAMLLSLQEEGGGNVASEDSTSADASGVPAGSTVMDMAVLPPLPAPATVAGSSPAAETPKPEATKAPAKKPDKADPAHLAAKAILEKYSRRSRG
jgi:pSer/pThr/pTyr-binding forkhead associated (FHA) protein